MSQAEQPVKIRTRTAKSAPRTSILAWMILSLGLTGFICGAVLLGWSYWQQRDELWSLGMPIAAGGQVLLLVGLVLQLERIWQSGRFASDQLQRVEHELQTLRTTTSLLSSTSGASSSQAFYAHMAEGAPPQMLLADVKSQLDLLALRMHDRG